MRRNTRRAAASNESAVSSCTGANPTAEINIELSHCLEALCSVRQKYFYRVVSNEGCIPKHKLGSNEGYLYIMATSIPSKRLFSQSGQI